MDATVITRPVWRRFACLSVFTSFIAGQLGGCSVYVTMPSRASEVCIQDLLLIAVAHSQELSDIHA